MGLEKAKELTIQLLSFLVFHRVSHDDTNSLPALTPPHVSIRSLHLSCILKARFYSTESQQLNLHPTCPLAVFKARMSDFK
jgi:hypothetical protein